MHLALKLHRIWIVAGWETVLKDLRVLSALRREFNSRPPIFDDEKTIFGGYFLNIKSSHLLENQLATGCGMLPGCFGVLRGCFGVLPEQRCIIQHLGAAIFIDSLISLSLCMHQFAGMSGLSTF